MKPEIKIDQEELTRSEIEKQMNFDKFMSGYSASAHKGWLTKGVKLYLSAAVSVIVVLTVSYLIFNTRSDSVSNAPFIDPPTPQFRVTPDKITLNTDRDTTITIGRGTTIFIPAGTFVSKNGTDVSGKIELNYREFHDQVDLIFSGIPMHYDTAGVHYQFESAGMFEITAKQNGEDLRIKRGKEITVNMISYNEGNNYNVYYLDTAQRKWIFQAENSLNNKKQVAEQVEARSLTPDMMLEAQKMIEPRKADPSLYNFTIDYNKDEFPELCIYDGVKFQVDKNFDQQLTKVVWQDVYIKRHDEQKYAVTFKYGSKSATVLAEPVLDEKDFDKAMAEYTKKRKEHLLATRRANDSLAAKRNANVWEANASNSTIKFANAVKNGTVYRSIVVDNLGVYNSDMYKGWLLQQVRDRMEAQQNIGFPTSEFVSVETGQKVSMKVLYLVKRDMNSIYPLQKNDLKKFPLAFAKSLDIIVGVGTDFKVYYIKDEELQSVKNDARAVSFKMYDIKPEQSDLQNIKTLLRI